MPKHLDDNDPQPVAPVRPGNEECCHSGCDPCIFDLHEDELERYRIALRAWEQRRTIEAKGAKPRTPS